MLKHKHLKLEQIHFRIVRGVDSRTKKYVLIRPNTVPAITASLGPAVHGNVDQYRIKFALSISPSLPSSLCKTQLKSYPWVKVKKITTMKQWLDDRVVVSCGYAAENKTKQKPKSEMWPTLAVIVTKFSGNES